MTVNEYQAVARMSLVSLSLAAICRESMRWKVFWLEKTDSGRHEVAARSAALDGRHRALLIMADGRTSSGLGSARHVGYCVSGAPHSSQKLFTHLWLVRTDGATNHNVGGDDDSYGAALNRPDRYYAKLLRILFAADHGLQIHDESGRRYDRVDGLVRCRAMAALLQRGLELCRLDGGR